MKARFQGFIAGVLVTVMLIATLALANPVTREVFYGVSVVVNGVRQNFDEDMIPFISEGRTFLPVRGIAEALGVPVNWDGYTQTVYVGQTPMPTPQDGYLIMATSADFPPFQFISDTPYTMYGTPTIDGIDGICVAIATIIAEELGLELRIVDMEFASIIPAVMAGQADIGMAGMTITEERAEIVYFSTPYFTESQVMLVPIDSEIQSASDLAGLRVGVIVGYIGDFIISNMDIEMSIQEVRTGNQGYSALRGGYMDVFIIDRAAAMLIISENPNFMIIEDPIAFHSESYGIAIRHGNTELRNSINAILERLIADGTIDRIIAHYILFT